MNGFADQSNEQIRTGDGFVQSAGGVQRFAGSLGERAAGFDVSEKKNGFHFRGNHFLIHSTISFAMSSGDLSLTILVARSCLGSVTLTKR